MEEELRMRIKTKIDEKVHNHEGTWIDWQYLHDAATLLTKCRYTLQYTYPFAYYMESSSRKELFGKLGGLFGFFNLEGFSKVGILIVCIMKFCS